MRDSPEARMGDINHWLLYMSGPLVQVSRLCSRSTRGRSREWRVLTLMAPPDLKFRSSMTLFAHATPDNRVFLDALQKYFKGKFDPETLSRL